MINFQDIIYLSKGNNRQKSAYQTLLKHGVFEKMKAFDPILTGTIPIDIDIPESDLDIVCYWKNIDDFIATLESHFSKEQKFTLRKEIINGKKTVIANFWLDKFELEIFGQNTPTITQNAYKHLLIEHQILQEKGENFKKEIIALKQSGIKTEPAFAQLFGLVGDPYLSLLNYKPMIFREAEMSHIAQIQIVRNAVKENTLSDPNLVTDKDVEDYLFNRGKGWVCIIENEVVGFSIVDLVDNNIWALFVHPNFEKQGIGKKLHNMMLDWYFQQTSTPIWLGTSPLTRAENFYILNDWITIGKHGKNETKFEMSKDNWAVKQTNF